jgi:cytochrome c-type biogenesis protein CcmE
MKGGTWKYVVTVVVVIVLVWFGVTAFNQSLTPYRTFAEARETGGYVQVNGTLPDPEGTTSNEGILRFDLQDENGEVMPIAYRGVKPANFEQATSVVAIGQYKEGAFQADQLLVKCPSKYQAEGAADDGYTDIETAPLEMKEKTGNPEGDQTEDNEAARDTY